MFYYSFNVGDYVGATAHLSNQEDLAYRRLLDLYYTDEDYIPLDTAKVARKVRCDLETVQSVLAEFFQETPDGWRHQRCEEELARYRLNHSQKSLAGKASAERRKNIRKASVDQMLNERSTAVATDAQRLLNGCTTDVQLTNNQELTNQEPVNNNPPTVPPRGSPIPFQSIVDLYNEICVPKGKPRATVLNKARQQAISRVWKSSPHARTIDWWREYFEAAMTIPWIVNGFTKGDGTIWNGADLGLLLQEKTITRVVEHSA
jgi:uncharacterized protein YdaU (DUF1376 family)